jgi:hypothetical protein
MVPKPGNVSLNRTWSLPELPNGVYEWWVQAVDNAFNGGAFAEGGMFTVGTTANDDGPAPRDFAVQGEYPNPARDGVTIRIDLPTTAEVTVRLYDVIGRTILATTPAVLPAGSGRDIVVDIFRLPAGVYVYRVEAARGGAVERGSGMLTVVR